MSESPKIPLTREEFHHKVEVRAYELWLNRMMLGGSWVTDTTSFDWFSASAQVSQTYCTTDGNDKDKDKQ